MTSTERSLLTDIQAVGLTIWGEARNESLLGRVAVGCVIRNRVRHKKRWSRNWRRVCHQKWQFSCWIKAGGAANYAAVDLWARYLMGDQRGADADLFVGDPEGAELCEALWLARGLIDGHVQDLTHGADHYYSPRAMSPRGSVPSWAAGRTPVAVIGRHRFYHLAP